ncbi:4-(cytidine 5'-diphospho)-2-C-methyl-D-erythritol kinase [Ornithinimicrobium sp. INDO-MA30-4]|uniref:4-(cytidine 5'-diphospho)-2-C-methyl-D-erythritol kinase n=1 Tax=Ornithinimicrobium sp. INDO-MA30-4 TaxID=2908651 RepID=UPI001F3BDCEC|nr:4-(cytidine 5'-diphospho)-2-C-methyl-D-erythritol kinase [Ornithinimicrobium sp. INDO-MA30-4]UJH70587.1 4-(cytidine 5'-diphospho)-2-C-methyl-D-erythritol kinase [Ornithinimicrobium sp. INDO-MA30-4]
MTDIQPSQRVTVRVPAKINLELAVGPRGDDGFHPLATVFHAVSLYDRITVTPAPDWSVTTVGPYADLVPDNQDNLAVRAAKLLASRAVELGAESQPGPVAVVMDKHIPVAAGMAGGSADAAGVLLACADLWDLALLREDLEPLAAELGSDVPFLLHGGNAVGTGRGDEVSPVLSRGEVHWVLWLSTDEGLSTPEVYAEFDRLHEGDEVPMPELSAELMTALRTMDPDAVGAALRNDLQAASISLQPRLAEVIDAGLELGARGALISGSGPTVAFVVASQAEALDLSMGLAARGPKGDIVRVTGPVAGATVVDSRGPGPSLGLA